MSTPPKPTSAAHFQKLVEIRREAPFAHIPRMQSVITYANLRRSMTLRHRDGKLLYAATGAPVTPAYPAHVRKPLGLPNIMQHYCHMTEDSSSMLIPRAVALTCLVDGGIDPMRRWYESPSAVMPIPMNVWAVASLYIDHQLTPDRIAVVFGLPTKGHGVKHVQACIDYALCSVPLWYLQEAARIHTNAGTLITQAQNAYAAAAYAANTQAIELAAGLSNVRPRTLAAALTLARSHMASIPLPKLGDPAPTEEDPVASVLDALLDLQDSLPPPPPSTVADLPGAYPMMAWYSSCTRAAP